MCNDDPFAVMAGLSVSPHLLPPHSHAAQRPRIPRDAEKFTDPERAAKFVQALEDLPRPDFSCRPDDHAAFLNDAMATAV